MKAADCQPPHEVPDEDLEMERACQELGLETDRQIALLLTHIKQIAPQVLVVAAL